MTDFSGSLPPTSRALSPSEFDNATTGGLAAGPWAGMMDLAWPPAEPLSEGGPPLPHEFGSAEPEMELAVESDLDVAMPHGQ